MIAARDDLAAIIVRALAEDGHALQDQDLIVVAQKVVSKAEDRIIDLDTVTPGPEACDLAARTGRDPRLCHLILQESDEILEILGRHVITLDKRGFVDTSSGVDSGNAGIYHDGWASLLPVDPDASARRIRAGIRALTGIAPGIIISDSMGSPWREGSAGAAIGLAGIAGLERPENGEKDLYGNPMWGSINRVDELAGAAGALMGQGDAARPVVLIRGATWTPDEHATIKDLLVPDPTSVYPLAREPQNI